MARELLSVRKRSTTQPGTYEAGFTDGQQFERERRKTNLRHLGMKLAEQGKIRPSKQKIRNGIDLFKP